MRSNAIVIGRIVFQNPAQMLLAQDNDVVQTLAPDRSDQPFGKAILPRRSWCDKAQSTMRPPFLALAFIFVTAVILLALLLPAARQSRPGHRARRAARIL